MSLIKCLKINAEAYVASAFSICIALSITGFINPVSAGSVKKVQLSVVAPYPEHFSVVTARKLASNAEESGLIINVKIASRSEQETSHTATPDLLILPLRSFATQIPALEVLELPFFFTGIEDVRKALDESLGDLLREKSRAQGWEILAFWDEGMHVMSGNRRYNDRINLTGMEFLLLRPDPVAEKQFKAFDAWTRSSQPESREELLRECKLGSRSATLQQVWYERLDRVHLDTSLTRHRYEGWIVLSPVVFWNKVEDKEKKVLKDVVASTTEWQRKDASKRELNALQKLKDSGMEVHELNAKQREGFVKRLPKWEALLSDSIDAELKMKLISLAKQKNN